MKKQLRKNSSPLKKIIIVAAIIVVLGITYGVSAYQLKLWPLDNSGTSQDSSDYVSPEEVQQNNNAKQDLVENESNTYDGTPSSDSSNITLTTKQEGGSLTVLTQLKGYSDGTCSLKVTNGSNSVTKEATVIYQSEYSTCAGFSIDTSVVGPGTWQLELTVTSKGVSVTKQASVEVQ